MENKIDFLLWVTRIFTVINVIWYLLPILRYIVIIFSCFSMIITSTRFPDIFDLCSFTQF